MRRFLTPSIVIIAIACFFLKSSYTLIAFNHLPNIKMPNQHAENKRSVTVFLPKELVEKLDRIAKQDDRSRSYMINKILEEQVAEAEAEEDARPTSQTFSIGIAPKANDADRAS